MQENKKSKVGMKTRVSETNRAPGWLLFSFLPCSAGILRVPTVFVGPALLLLSSPFSGTGTPACAPLLNRNPLELGSHTASHSPNAREEAEAHLTKPNFLIANPELEFNLSRLEPTRYNFLIANK
jgi:hypothetical protein